MKLTLQVRTAYSSHTITGQNKDNQWATKSTSQRDTTAVANSTITFFDARVSLVTQKVLLSPQVREVYGVMKQVRIYSQAFIEWFDKQLQSSEFYEDRVHTIREGIDQSSN
jgi:hypothetical protein